MSKNNFMGIPSGGGGNPSPTPTGNKYDPTALISSLVGLGTQALSNKQQRKLEAQRRKYDTAQWERQNKYNHPIEQMARLAAAGLNPNLIYGSSPGSAVGNAGAIPAGQAPQYELNNPVTGYMNTKVQQAQANNMNTSAMKNVSQANLSEEQANRINKLLASDITMAEEGAKRSITDTFLKDLEKTGKAKHYLANMAAETKKAVEEGSIAEARKHIVELDAKLAKQGIRPQDKQWITLMARIFGIDVSEPGKNMKWVHDNVLNKLRYYNIPRF